MAFRAEYEDLLQQQLLTTVFRPGNRVYPEWRGYKPGEIITGRVIKRCGSDQRGIAPIFTPQKIPLKILSISVVAVSELCPDDFAGSSWDVTDAETLNQHIYRIYNKNLPEYGNLVTRIRLAYLEASASRLRA